MTAQMLWVETTTDEEARALDRQIWDFSTREEPDGTIISQAPGPAPENGEFWSDALDRIKDDPDQRYAMARRHLPLPAAWREMAVALRMKIRKARKEKTGYEDLLRELHHLAAMSSYAGYGIIQRVPYVRLAGLDLTYDRVGFNQLLLLGATDGKWMRELWGEPSTHSTAAELYEDMLKGDLERLNAEKKQEDSEQMDRLFANWNDEDKSEEPQRQLPNEPRRRSLLGWLFGR
ncbi:hypothetical protein Rleg4DRAFT_1866 [Rhizobium leguminosarum bv. trifolii WSM2297]|uniref:Uncharacterized protein n=1 Tax=Rhizobium leguminosarum bv. trifolii WSM2297 TaxID=754762 RepID=J0W3G8_RHILT|nr:hypothetical protein [Rhizobium leguminosarum]EJC80246.1 hypothetical protein Rleg4DRAFT_1866 [Rhizobium leguminosarum bv. trifolii WSM2297]